MQSTRNSNRTTNRFIQHFLYICRNDKHSVLDDGLSFRREKIKRDSVIETFQAQLSLKSYKYSFYCLVNFN